MKTTREQIKKTKEKIKRLNEHNEERDTVIVHLTIKDESSVLSDFTAEGREIISNEMASFIDNVVKPIKPKQNIHLKIKCNKVNSEKEAVYKNAIKNYYINEFAEIDKKLKTNLIMSMIMLIAGLVGFGLLYILSAINTPFLILELLEVASWVFLWEMVDLLCLQRRFIKYKQLKKLKIIFAKVTFVNND
ncbi:MAG: hypothetical protein E7345_04835 [Clostridiales bacterium]|nr:hypothetical protein [Clostridiales bacterium]